MMYKDLVTAVKRWLTVVGITVSDTLLERLLKSHPDYPSLLSVKDSLGSIGLHVEAHMIEDRDWTKLPPSVLFFSGGKKGQYIIADGATAARLEKDGMLDHWDGVALIVVKQHGWRNDENDRYMADERMFTVSLIVGLSACIICLLMYGSAVLVITAMTGLFIAALIIQKDLGIKNSLSDSLCSIGVSTDCNAVLRSGASKIFGKISLSDLLFTYFLSFLLSVVSGSAFLPVLALLPLPVIIFSIFYQWRIARQWCVLCLLSSVVLLLQMVLLHAEIRGLSLETIPVTDVLRDLFAAVATGTLLTGVVRPYLNRNLKIREQLYRASKFKNDEKVFVMLTRDQRRVDTARFVDELELGNPDADISLIVACSPYCKPCAIFHARLEQMLHKYADALSVRIRFVIDATDQESERTRAAALLLARNKIAASDGHFLADWYKWMDEKKWMTKYYTDQATDVLDVLGQHSQWAIQNGVQYTPTVYLNGYQVPAQYSLPESVEMIGRIVEGFDGEMN